MIRGMHAMFYSPRRPKPLRVFLPRQLGLPGTDVGGGWLIFDVPEADLGCIRPKAASPPPATPTSRSIATTSTTPSRS